ncbi:MAG: IS66 family insertion sequence element accessory protein TnpB [Lachnospiraceae bacterium]|nr:IS66 family insertion sequence element accessory protein TnpB [Lachnospiraceae bacterium]
MSRKYCKRSDQEWFTLIQDCRTSGLTISAWCIQNEVTQKALSYHTRKLRQKGYSIPPKTRGTAVPAKQELFCIDLSEEKTADKEAVVAPDNAAIRIDYHGILIEVTNQAAQDTLSNTFLALRNLC